MPFDPDQYLAETGGFNPDQYLAATAPAAPEPGKLESLTRGAAQGATLGYADELTGALGALKDKVGGADQNLGDLYRKERDESRANYGAAESANPWTYKAGELGGGVASLAAAPEIKGLQGMVALGAASGLGNSKADLTEGDLAGAAKDTAIGGAMGAAGYGAGKVISKIPGAIAYGSKKAMSSLLGPSMEAIDARLANPAAIREAGAGGLDAIAERLPKAVGSMKEQVGDLSEKAWDTLRDRPLLKYGARDKGAILGQITNLQNDLMTNGQIVGDANQQAFAKLQSLRDSISKMEGKRLPESSMKSLIQDLDPNINWDNPINKPTNMSLERLRTQIDAHLKEVNPKYEAAMDPVSQRQNVVDYLTRKMNLKNSGEGLTPTDATMGNLKNVLNEGKGVTQEYLGKLKEFTGEDIPGAVQNYKYAQEFEKPYMNGSRNAVAGAAIGGAVGHFLPIPGGAWLGSAAGALAGRQIDKEGGALAGHMIDWWVENRPQMFGQYAPVLQKALQKGTQALTAAHYVLQQQDPNYNVMMRALGQ